MLNIYEKEETAGVVSSRRATGIGLHKVLKAVVWDDFFFHITIILLIKKSFSF
jgi:hypothetical protein